MAQRKSKEVLRDNLRLLMRRDEVDTKSVSQKSGLDKKTINNVLNARHEPRLDVLDAIAKVFGVSPWELLLPKLTAELAQDTKNIDRLFNVYQSTDQTGRHSIMSIAEMAARYNSEGDQR